MWIMLLVIADVELLLVIALAYLLMCHSNMVAHFKEVVS